MNKVELASLVGGALQEKFNKSFEKVIENLQDTNTSFKNKRSITIKLDFVQNETRDDVSVSIDVVEKLAPQAAMKTSFYIGKNLENGEVYAEEYGKQIKGQMSIADYEQPVQKIGGELVDTSTGEVLQAEESKVIDLRKASAL